MNINLVVTRLIYENARVFHRDETNIKQEQQQ